MGWIAQRLKRAWWLVNVTFLAVASVPVAAETLYVTDQLQLGLFERPSSDSRRLERLGSGTALEVLSKGGAYHRVETPAGRTGWVKSAFLVAEEPASARLAVALAQLEAAESELVRLRAEPSAQECEAQCALRIGLFEERIAELERARRRLQEVAEYYEHGRDLRAAQGVGLSVALPEESHWALAAGGVSLLVLGFASGAAYISWRVRRRFQGYRVW